MEAACSFVRAPRSSAFDVTILDKLTYKTPQSIYLRYGCSLPFPSSSNRKLSSSSLSLEHRVITSFGKDFLCRLGLGSSDQHFTALNVFSGYLVTAEIWSSHSIHTSSGSRNMSFVGLKIMMSGAGVGTPDCSRSWNGSVFSDCEWRTIGNLDSGKLSPPCSRAMGAMMTLRFPALLQCKIQSCKMACLGHGFGAFDRRAAEQSLQDFYVFSLRAKGKSRSQGGGFHLFEATGQSGTGQPVPEEENPEPAPEQEPPPVPGNTLDLPAVSPVDSDPPEVDWRAFRARLVVTEHTISSNEPGTSTDEEITDGTLVSSLGMRWAHPILAPEAGCVLIATDKIDGQQSFERSVILLLSPGSSNPREGPYGLILNRPLSSRIKDIKPHDQTLVKFFGNCQVHHGGPLDEEMFLLLHGTQGVNGYREVIPGVYYGAASGLEEIMKGKSPLHYRFFFGYSGWGVEQLKKEIDAGLWCVAACSTDLITGDSAAGLWEEILLLMGGKYGELSKRPR